jgi:hypothetical protein
MDFGGGYSGYEVISPAGKILMVEKTSGAIIGSLLFQVKRDIATGDPKVMTEQVEQACLDAKEVSILSPDEFWKIYSHAK